MIPGDRVKELDKAGMPTGRLGTVSHAADGQYRVDWDHGSPRDGWYDSHQVEFA